MDLAIDLSMFFSDSENLYRSPFVSENSAVSEPEKKADKTVKTTIIIISAMKKSMYLILKPEISHVMTYPA